MTSRRHTVLAVVGALSLLGAAPSAASLGIPVATPVATRASTAAASSTVKDLGAVAVGGAIVEPGPMVDDAHVFWETCGVAGACFEYSFDVAPGGAGLRVMLDSPDNADIWAFRLRTPSGAVIDAVKVDPTEVEHSELRTNAWTMELATIPAPEAGRWEMLVVPINVKDGTFRLRVQLNGETPAIDGPQLPNLVSVPPFGLGFVAPAQQFRVPPGNPVAPPNADVAGQHPFSCLAEEMVNDSVTKCLRFGIGMANTGAGPLELRFDRSKIDGVMTQKVRGDDTEYTDGPRYHFHESHLHFHNKDMATTELFRVTDSNAKKHRLEPAGSSTKHGFCLDDSLIFDINSFNSDQQYEDPSNCEFAPTPQTDPNAPTEGRMVLTRGWTDVYPGYLPGMYVDFSSLGAGDYVLRLTADPSGRVVESDETDNISYTWLHVGTDDAIAVRERGFGTSPWDAKKRVIAASVWPV